MEIVKTSIFKAVLFTYDSQPVMALQQNCSKLAFAN